jgi:tryptophan halogenase
MSPVQRRVESLLVLGSGTAGCLAAIAVRTHLPGISVRMVRSPSIGIIGVGEGTTAAVPKILHDALRLDVTDFYREVDPIWKLGIRYLWGPRDTFHYSFGKQMTNWLPDVAKPLGFFCQDSCTCVGIEATLMEHGKAFLRHPQFGFPLITPNHAYHLENRLFVGYLEKMALARGVTVVDDTVATVAVSDQGIKSLTMESGRTETADLYIDCSGFRSELLGSALKEPFTSFGSTLFCDRACIGGWSRAPNEPVHPYTIAETMAAGWCWRIDHKHLVHRGYVYSSAFISDQAAEQEFRLKNPRLQETRLVKFRSGRHHRPWVKNVCAIGNAFGFVEPLEATAIAAICEGATALVHSLATNDGCITATLQAAYNSKFSRYWDAIRRFLAVHYKYNDRLDTDFWREVRATVDLAGAEDICEFFRENGPDISWQETLLEPEDQFGIEGYLTMFVGQRVPYETLYTPTAAGKASVRAFREAVRRDASHGCGVEEALRMIRDPEWAWPPNFYGAP